MFLHKDFCPGSGRFHRKGQQKPRDITFPFFARRFFRDFAARGRFDRADPCKEDERFFDGLSYIGEAELGCWLYGENEL
jgi:hypothetical protein